MATVRKGISKKIRFEVFKRDSFKCQYCGASAPEAVLVVDHIDPVSKGGAHEIINFITACQPCNAGKSDRTLSDNTALAKQRTQLEELNERREQLEMMLDWRNGLKSLDEETVAAVVAEWSQQTKEQYYLNDTGVQSVKKLLAKYSLAEVLDAVQVAATTYLKFDSEGKLTAESVGYAWSKVKGIAHNKKEGVDQYCFYVRAIVRNRFEYADDHVSLRLIKELKALGAEDEYLKELAVEARSWSQWQRSMEDAIEEFERPF